MCAAPALRNALAAEASDSVHDKQALPVDPETELRKFASRAILLVEDMPINQEIAMDVLKSLGIQNVSGVSGGVLALNAIALSKHSAPFDVLMCDLQMPGMDGFDFFESMCESGFSGGLIVKRKLLDLEGTLKQLK